MCIRDSYDSDIDPHGVIRTTRADGYCLESIYLYYHQDDFNLDVIRFNVLSHRFTVTYYRNGLSHFDEKEVHDESALELLDIIARATLRGETSDKGEEIIVNVFNNWKSFCDKLGFDVVQLFEVPVSC